MGTESTYKGKVTLLKLFAGSGLVVILIAGAAFLLNTQSAEPENVTTNTPTTSVAETPAPHPATAETVRENEQRAASTPGSSASAETATQAERIAIEEEGVPAVSEKPAKSN